MLSVTARKRFGDFTLDATWSSDQPIVALVGPSGSGKTLTLQCIAGLIAPDSGRIVSAGRTLFDSSAAHQPSAAAARHRVCIPRLRALPSYDGGAERVIRADQDPFTAPKRGARRRACGSHQGHHRAARIARIDVAVSSRSIGRSAAARRTGSRACHRSRCAAARRAVLGARRPTPARAVGRAQPDAARVGQGRGPRDTRFARGLSDRRHGRAVRARQHNRRGIEERPAVAPILRARRAIDRRQKHPARDDRRFQRRFDRARLARRDASRRRGRRAIRCTRAPAISWPSSSGRSTCG